MNNTLFRKESLAGISSPEQLNDYIKVSNPSIWMVIAALFILLAAVLVWGITGTLPTTVQVRGVVSGGNAVCYVEEKDAGTIAAGQAVQASAENGSSVNGHVAAVGAVPLSASEIASELKSDYINQQLTKGGFAVKVTVALDSGVPDGTLLNLGIVTDSMKPIDFLLN
jgi:hypothetical protein